MDATQQNPSPPRVDEPERCDLAAIFRRFAGLKAGPGEWDRIHPDRNRIERPKPQTHEAAADMWLGALLDTTHRGTGWPRSTVRGFTGNNLWFLLAAEDFGRLVARVPPEKIEAAFEALGKPGGWVVLAGDEPGTGKTGLAYLLGLRELCQRALSLAVESWEWRGECWEKMPTHRYVEWPRALNIEKSRFRPGSLGSYIRQLEKAELLVVDDIGKVKGWELQELELVLAQRYAEHLRTILVLRVAGGTEVEEVLGRATYSRLTERGVVITCGWSPYR